MDGLDGQTSLLEFMNLIVHQGDEWADHKRRSAPRQSRQLVAKRLARAGGHDQQGVFSRRDCLADGLLVGPEPGEAEGILQKLGKSCKRWNFR